MSPNGWKELLCSYFSKTCINQLGEPLEAEEFEIVRVENDGAVIFKRFDVFLEIGYEAETAPSYSPTVVIGFGVRKYDEAGGPAGVPMWFVIRDDESAEKYSSWKFSTEAELKSVLLRIKDEVLQRHARHLWKHPEVLEQLLFDFRKSLQERGGDKS